MRGEVIRDWQKLDKHRLGLSRIFNLITPHGDSHDSEICFTDLALDSDRSCAANQYLLLRRSKDFQMIKEAQGSPAWRSSIR